MKKVNDSKKMSFLATKAKYPDSYILVRLTDEQDGIPLYLFDNYGEALRKQSDLENTASLDERNKWEYIVYDNKREYMSPFCVFAGSNLHRGIFGCGEN
jgi:hypothetical protein